MGFRLVLKSVTLGDLEGIMAVILRYSTEFGSFEADYIKVVEDRLLICDRNLLNGVMTLDPRYLFYQLLVFLVVEAPN